MKDGEVSGLRVLKENKISFHCILAALYFIMLPLTIATNTASDSLLKLMAVPIGAYFIISLVFYNKPFGINMVHILLAVYTVAMIIAMLVDPTEDAIKATLGYFMNAALFICISAVKYNEKELKVFEYVQVALLVIITVITLRSNATVFDRTTLEIFGQTTDPNYFVGFFIFPLTVAMKKIYESKYRIFYIILFVFALYAIVMSGSRGGLLAVMAIIITFSFIYPEGRKKKAIIFLAALTALIVLWIIALPFLPESIIERMTVEDIIETKGTGRVTIWISMLNEMKESTWELFVGRGLLAKHTLILGGAELEVVAHNHIMQVMYNQGIIGVIAFLLLVIVALARCRHKRKTVTIALIGMLVLSISLSFNASTKSFWNLIVYAAFAFPESLNITEGDANTELN